MRIKNLDYQNCADAIRDGLKDRVGTFQECWKGGGPQNFVFGGSKAGGVKYFDRKRGLKLYVGVVMKEAQESPLEVYHDEVAK